MPDSLLPLLPWIAASLALAAILCALLAATAIGGLLGVLAMGAGLVAGVRIRKGEEAFAPPSALKRFVESYVAGREKKAAQVNGENGGDGKEEKTGAGAKDWKPGELKPQRKL